MSDQTNENNLNNTDSAGNSEAGGSGLQAQFEDLQKQVEKYKNGYIAYSLGNFVFDQNFSPETSNGLVLKVAMANKKIEKVELLKIGFSANFQPFLLTQ